MDIINKWIVISNLWLLQNIVEKNNHVPVHFACGQVYLWEEFLKVKLLGQSIYMHCKFHSHRAMYITSPICR